MNRFVIAAALLAVLSACEGKLNLLNANMPHHKEACHEGPDAPHADCWTLAADYCKNHYGRSWDQVRGFMAQYSTHTGAAALLLRGDEASVFLQKFGEAEGIGPFPAGVDVYLAQWREDYTGGHVTVLAGSGRCFVKGMVNNRWPVEAVSPHLSHVRDQGRIPQLFQ